MTNILDEILKHIPNADKRISDSVFEGANIILYTKDKDFYINPGSLIRDIVGIIKKRVELRADPSLCLEQEEAEVIMKKLLPEDAKCTQFQFDAQRSVVIIEAEKPGLAIGKQGELLREIKQKTFWSPEIVRTPAIRSKIIENIRAVLFENNDERKKFLNKIGHRIYDGWTKEKRDDWVRVTFLGGARQVGRSCIFVQTAESRVILDCGINVAMNDHNAYPYLDSPEFKIEELDAVILSHAHLDHSGFVPYLYRMGYRGPVYCTPPTRDISALLALDYIGVTFKQAKKMLFEISDVKEMVNHTITLDWGEVTDITPDLRLTFYNSGHILGSSMVHLHIGNGAHNLMYSLDARTPVTIFDADGYPQFTPIGTLIDDMMKKHAHQIEYAAQGVEELSNLAGWKTIAFDPHTLKTHIVPITRLIRHPITEDLYEIRTTSGRKATVTRSHSVFTARNGDVQAIRVSELSPGDFIVGPKHIPESHHSPVITLLPHAKQLRIALVDEKELNRVITSYSPHLSSLPEQDRREAPAWIRDHFRGLYKREIINKYHVHERRINRVFKHLAIPFHSRASPVLPHLFAFTPDFARFLGYYISEGCPSKDSQSITLSNTSLDILKDCSDIMQKTFGIEGDLREKDTVILFHSKQIKYLLSEVLHCGKNAYDKRVPKELLHADKELMRHFLYGYFSGDGGIRTRESGREISANSKSKGLIQDLTFMLLQFDLVPTLEFNRTSRMHNLHIYHAEKIKSFLNEIGMRNSAVPLLTAEVQHRKRKSSFDLRLPLFSLSKRAQLGLARTQWKDAQSCGISVLQEKNSLLEPSDRRLIHSDLFFDQIISIQRVQPTSSYVYDFSVEGYENFVGGEGFLSLHNTGDMKFLRSKLLEAAETRFPRLESVIIESTYGGKDDVLASREDAEAEVINSIKETIERGGKILIPVLGVGRAQEVMVILEEAIRMGKMPKFPIYVHGMVWDVTAIHTAYPDYLNNTIRKAIFHHDQNPFLSDIFLKVSSRKEQMQIIEETGPAVIVATAGMLNAGASLEYFKHLASNPKNTILFCTYLAENTIGRKVQQGDKQITIMDGDKPEVIPVNLQVKTVTALTGHAGRTELLRFIHSLNPRPKRIMVQHGESSKCLDLASTLHKLNRVETNAPKNLETIRVY